MTVATMVADDALTYLFVPGNRPVLLRAERLLARAVLMASC